MNRDAIVGAIPPGRGSVAVEGEGARAAAVAELLGDLMHGQEPPRAVVVADGGVDAIAAALGRVADGGAVIVVAPTPESAPLDLYADLHVRGLELVVLD